MYEWRTWKTTNSTKQIRTFIVDDVDIDAFLLEEETHEIVDLQSNGEHQRRRAGFVFRIDVHVAVVQQTLNDRKPS